MEKQVKTRRSYNCIFRQNELKERKLFMVEHYASNGDLEKSEEYNEEGELICSMDFEYENGLLTLQKTKQLVDDVYKELKKEATYKDGLIQKETEWFDHGGFIQTTYSYDEDKRITSAKKIDDEQATHGRIDYFYLEDNSTLEEHFDEDEDLVMEAWTICDDQGREVKYVEQIPDTPLSTIESTYYDDDAILEQQIYWDERLVTTVNQVFDERGELIKRIIKDFDADTQTEHHFHWNAKNELQREEVYKDGQMQSAEEYVYDRFGETIEYRLIKQTWQNVHTADIVQYDIEYYN